MKTPAVLLASLLAAASPTAIAQPAKVVSAATQPQAPVEFGVPGEIPVDRLWADFSARADETTAYREHEVADDLFDKRNDADGVACKAGYNDLLRASRRVPVGFEIWYVLHACASKLNDVARVQQSEQAMAALTRYAFAGLPPDHGRTAIRVFQINDAYSMALASGEQTSYSFYDLADTVNGDPLVLGLRDPETGRERELRFDFVSSVIAIRHHGDDSLYPDEGKEIARATIKSMAAQEKTGTALEAQALVDAYDGDDAKTMDTIIALARGGSYGAALATSKCVLDKNSGCAQQAVDALLPFAEKGFAHPMVLLAHAYAQGRGVKRDPDAAKTLLRGAAKRVGDGDAYSQYLAGGWQYDDTTAIDDWVFTQVAHSADAGDPSAAMSAAFYSILKRPDANAGLNARELAWVQLAERRGMATAGHLLAVDAAAHKDWPKVVMYLRKWADRNDDAAAGLATAYEMGNIAGVPRDNALALMWRRRAGMLGDVYSMRIVAFHEFGLGTPEARKIGMDWIYCAASTGDLDAELDLAYALTSRVSSDADAAESMTRGVKLYRAIMAEQDSPRARRAFAVLLMDGRGVGKDIAQARQLLLKDANAGDTESQVALAQAIIQNKLGKGDPAEAWAWVRKADAKGDHQAREMIAGAMFSGNDGLPLDRRGALEMIGKLAATGDTQAGNDLAWYLCTGPDAALRDPAKGLIAITAVVKDDPIAAFQDTQAGCLAATGDFAQAIDFQQRAIAGAPTGATEMLKRMQARLALYKKKQTYIEDPSQPAMASPSPPAPATTPSKPVAGG